MSKKVSSESVVKDIRRRTRNKYSSEEKIRIVLEGLQEQFPYQPGGGRCCRPF